ncbi:MAG: SBBP repeat-containing protein [Ignavibacteria bacterium]
MFKLLKILTILLLGALNGTVYTQWSSQYEGHFTGDQPSTESVAYSIAADSGYSYVVGYTSDMTGSSMCIVKYDVNGDTVWTSSFNGGEGQFIENKAYAVVVDKLRNVIITGYATTPNGIDIATVKYSPSGVEQWARYYNDSLNLDDKAYAITLDAFNNIYITGYTTVSQNETQYIVIKYYQNGDSAWTRLGEGHHDTATSITMVGNNYVAITGRSLNNSSIPDIVTVLYDANTGDQIWSSALGLSANIDAKGNAITSDAYGNVYVTGYVTQPESGKDIVVIKYNTDGFLWEKTFEGNFDDIGNSIGLSAYGDVIVTGTTAASDGSTNYLTASYNSTGDLEWQKGYNGPGNATDVAYKMAVSTADNSVYVTGSSMSGTDEGSTDMLTIKYDIATGDAIDSSRLSTSSANADISYDITIDQTQNVYITGFTLPTGGNNLNSGAKILTAKFNNFKKNNHKNTVSSVPKNFKLYQNYPNPFNPGTIIKFEVGKSSNVKLVVYDMVGKEVQTLINNNYNPGTYTVNFNKPGIASGVYFYVLTAGEFRDIKKMILLK